MFKKAVTSIALIVAFIGTMNAQPVSVDQQDCPLVCPLLYEPICGTNGDNFMEFDNACELKVQNCRLRNASGRSFVALDVNFCHTELIDNWNNLLTKLGNLDLSKQECLIACPLNIQPVCISNGKYRAVVDNACMMDTINCALGTTDTFKVLKSGSC